VCGQDSEVTPLPSIGPPPAVVRGTVVDPAGPVAGATILVEVTDMARRRIVFQTRARTDIEGRYEADLSPVEASRLGIQVNVLSPRHEEGMKIEITDRASLPVEIPVEVKPGSSVKGHVRTDGGDPVAGAHVEVPYVRPTKSEFDGFYTILGLPAMGRFSITAIAEGYAPQTQVFEIGAAGSQAEVDFALKPERLVRGKVTDAEGNPVEGAKVTLYLPLQRTWKESDAEGEFEIRDLPYEASRAVVLASHPDFAAYKKETEIREGNTTVTLELERGGTLEGRVTDVTGRPVPGARIGLALPDALPNFANQTDGEGHFRIEHLAAGEVTVTILPPSGAAFERTGELILRERGNQVTGNVDPWADGSASDFQGTRAGPRVRLERRDRAADEKRGDERAPVAVYEGDIGEDGLSMTGTLRMHESGREGTWRAERKQGTVEDLSGLWMWVESLEAAKVSFAPARERIQIENDEVARVEEVLGEGWALEGVAEAEDGTPVSGAQVRLLQWDGQPVGGQLGTSGEDGRFRAGNLPKGQVMIEVSHPEHGHATALLEGPVEEAAEPRTFAMSSASGVGGSIDEAESLFADSPKVGEAAPEFTAKILDGDEIHLADLKGKVALLDFWASWCGPCIAELPNLNAIWEAFGKRDDFAMLSVSLDFEEKDLRAALEEHKIGWPQIFDGKGWDAELGTAFGVMAIPRVFVIGPDGTILATDLRGEAIRRAVEEALDKLGSREPRTDTD
jgi:peroxiredoxin/protocatechuate 3,4-dioxygenase beta subunit